jgi:hypothetical protein
MEAVGWTLGLRRRGRRARSLLVRARAALLAWRHGPPALLGLWMTVVACLAAWHGWGFATIALDEAIYKASAVHYAVDGLPGALFSDLTARGPARLFPLLISPFFRVFDADVAIALSRALNAVLFASAAVPAYLLARLAVRSRWKAAIAAAASVTVPWLTLTSVLYAESLGYMMFMWILWLIVRATRAPAAWRDGAALAAIVLGTTIRVQFAFILPAYIAVALLARRRDARRRGLGAGDWRWTLRRAAAAHPVTAAGIALAVLIAALRLASGALGRDFSALFGSYSEIQDRTTTGPDLLHAGLFEVVALSLGVGVLPAVLAAAWYARTLRSGHDSQARELVVASLVVLAVLTALTIYAQGGYLVERSEERYYIYAVPLLWIGALAALEAPVHARPIALAAGGLAVLCAVVDLVVPLTPQATFLAPASASVRHALEAGLADAANAIGYDRIATRADALALLVLALGLAAARIWTRAPWARGWLLAGGLALQLGVTGYAMGAMRGEVSGLQDQVVDDTAPLAFIDRTTPGRAAVAYFNNELAGSARQQGVAASHQLALTFWNDEIRRWIDVPALGVPPVGSPMDALPVSAAAVDEATGRLVGAPATTWIAQGIDSPVAAVAGRRVAAGAAGELLRVDGPLRLRWRAERLDAEGLPRSREPIRLSAWIERPTVVELTLAGRGAGLLAQRIALGGSPRRVVVPRGERRRVRFTLCRAGAVRGSIVATSGSFGDARQIIASELRSVRLRDAPAGAC